MVVNVRSDVERERGQALIEEVGRLRKDAAVFDDILGFRSNKTPITAVVADLLDSKDPGRRKAIARIARTLGTRP